MKLEAYLEALRNCPDEFVEKNDEQSCWKLTDELGVYDNWPIFLNADFENVVEDLQKSDYRLIENSDNGRKKRFNYIPGTVRLQVFDWTSPGFVRGNEQEKQRQMKDYNMTIMLHPYQENKIEGIHWQRAIARVIENISKYIQKENIPACFPYSRGWNDLENYSRIVYYPDEKED